MTASTQAWTDYWSTNADAGCLTQAPAALRDCLQAIWRELAVSLAAGASVLDIAAGGGAVFSTMAAVREDLVFTGIDSAKVGPAAVAIGVRGGVQADALPFEDGCFDAITSQFGIEYCAPAAIAEAVRVGARGACLSFICHHADSMAVRHNAARRSAMVAMEGAGLFALARRIAMGHPQDGETADAVTRARHAHRAQSIVEELPIALGQALNSHHPVALVDAIRAKAHGEIERLGAMEAAALDQAGATRIVDQLASLGVASSARPLRIGDGAPIAWSITGTIR